MTDDENPYVESERKTRERFKRREAQARTYVARAEGKVVCEKLIPDLSRFMLSEAAPPTPGDLRVAMCELRELAPEELALCALTPLLHGIAVGRKRKRDKKSAEMRLKLAMGRALHRTLFMKGLLKERRTQRAYKKIVASKNKNVTAWGYRKKYRVEDWEKEQFVRAGNWLLDCVLHALPEYIVRGPDGFPCLTERGGELAPVHEDLVYRNPVFQPSTKPLKGWIGWRSGAYWDDGTRISAPFVRDSHPDTRKAIKLAFHDGSVQQHVDGVNALQSVGWTINRTLLPVVEKFAGKIRKKSTKLLPGPGGVGKRSASFLWRKTSQPRSAWVKRYSAFR